MGLSSDSQSYHNILFHIYNFCIPPIPHPVFQGNAAYSSILRRCIPQLGYNEVSLCPCNVHPLCILDLHSGNLHTFFLLYSVDHSSILHISSLLLGCNMVSKAGNAHSYHIPSHTCNLCSDSSSPGSGRPTSTLHIYFLLFGCNTVFLMGNLSYLHTHTRT